MMGIRHDLKRSISLVVGNNRNGSYATQANRKQVLAQFADDLVSKGYALRDVRHLKQKHIAAVVKHWQAKGLASATLKNRTAVLRRLCELINKPNLIPSNSELNIPQRIYVAKTNRAVTNANFNLITNDYIRVSLELQRVFGLRREESLKIKPHMADKGNTLQLLPSWCKGGRGREIPIQTDEQRYWLTEAKKLVDHYGHSLIPPNKTYIQQRSLYDKQIVRANLRKMHGLRHAYAQKRYKELTGWEAPINGGPTASQLTAAEKKLDYQARMTLTEELGHSREQITVNYLGR